MSQVTILRHKGWLALMATLLGLLLLAMAMPVVKADTSTDLNRALISQKFYLTDDVKADPTYLAKNPNLEQQVKDAINKVKGKADIRVAFISNKIIPSNFGGSTQRYGEDIYQNINTPDGLIIINAQQNLAVVLSDKLNASERQAIIDESRSALVASPTTGTVQLIEKMGEKIAGNATAGTITAIAIPLVIVLVIAGIAFFLMNNAKKSWKAKVDQVENLANEVSDQVVKVSDEVNFLPDANRAQSDVQFGAATRNFSEANTRLGELKNASGFQLLLKGADYDRQLNLTNAQFSEARQALSQVAQQIQRSLPG